MKFIIFTDLDGTLLDENYSFKYAKKIIDILKVKTIPIIFCSGKTRVEQEVYIKKIGIRNPFIVEDGSAIFIPKNYFGYTVGKNKNGYEVIELGENFEKIRKEINRIQRMYKIVGYSDMNIEDVAKITNLSLNEAILAVKREYSETVVEADEIALEKLRKKFNVVVGGRFIHVFGKNADKGKSVKILTELYKKKFGNIKTIGIGNSYNDEPMLKAVDIPVLVRNPNGKHVDIKIKNIQKMDGIATVGWVEMVKKFILGDGYV